MLRLAFNGTWRLCRNATSMEIYKEAQQYQVEIKQREGILLEYNVQLGRLRGLVDGVLKALRAASSDCESDQFKMEMMLSEVAVWSLRHKAFHTRQRRVLHVELCRLLGELKKLFEAVWVQENPGKPFSNGFRQMLRSLDAFSLDDSVANLSFDDIREQACQLTEHNIESKDPLKYKAPVALPASTNSKFST